MQNGSLFVIEGEKPGENLQKETGAAVIIVSHWLCVLSLLSLYTISIFCIGVPRMKEIHLAFIGFGNVAQGLTQILQEQGDYFAMRFGARFYITAITDPIKGNAFNPEGLSPASLLEAAKQPGGLKNLPGNQPDWDAMEMIQNSPTDVVIEMSYTNLQTGEPSTSYMAEALRRKKHVITTNKGPIALHFDELASIARLHQVQIGLEGTVMSGTPAVRVGRQLLAASGIRRMQGILNGTTNYILTRMESGSSYEEALAEAQAQGYAEADPTGDVEGYDAAAKVAILSRLVLGVSVPFASVERKGITGLTKADIAAAHAEGKHWKLVGTVEKDGNAVRACVQPECLPDAHPLARVSGATNALVYNTNYLGDITLVGPGAGRLQTGFAIIQDLFCIYQIQQSI
jgi:homoserine dehydrogenase